MSQVLRLDSLPDPHTGFSSLGMDSLMAVELRNRLQRQLGSQHTLSATLLFNHSSIIRMADYLAVRLLGTPEKKQEPTKHPVVQHDAIEVIRLYGTGQGTSNGERQL